MTFDLSYQYHKLHNPNYSTIRVTTCTALSSTVLLWDNFDKKYCCGTKKVHFVLLWDFFYWPIFWGDKKYGFGTKKIHFVLFWDFFGLFFGGTLFWYYWILHLWVFHPGLTNIVIQWFYNCSAIVILWLYTEYIAWRWNWNIFMF